MHDRTPPSGSRRQHSRQRVEGVNGRFTLSSDVRIVDISPRGVGIETSTYLGVGRDYDLRLERNGRPVQLQGRVVWSTLVRTRRDDRGDVYPVYRAGLALLDGARDDGSHVTG